MPLVVLAARDGGKMPPLHLEVIVVTSSSILGIHGSTSLQTFFLRGKEGGLAVGKGFEVAAVAQSLLSLKGSIGLLFKLGEEGGPDEEGMLSELYPFLSYLKRRRLGEHCCYVNTTVLC